MFNKLLQSLRQQPSPSQAAPANENIPLIAKEADPAWVLFCLRGYLARLRQHHAERGALLASPEERAHFEEARALERALVWRYFERR